MERESTECAIITYASQNYQAGQAVLLIFIVSGQYSVNG
jgi:hypothetical protein